MQTQFYNDAFAEPYNISEHKTNDTTTQMKILNISGHSVVSPGSVTQLVTCLTADPGVTISIPAQSHIFVEIDHEIISTVILLPSADSRRVVVSYKQKYVHHVLVNRFVKLAQEKSVVN